MSVEPPKKVQRRRVVIFSVLAYALAWALWASGVVPRLHNTGVIGSADEHHPTVGAVQHFAKNDEDHDRFQVARCCVRNWALLQAPQRVTPSSGEEKSEVSNQAETTKSDVIKALTTSTMPIS